MASDIFPAADTSAAIIIATGVTSISRLDSNDDRSGPIRPPFLFQPCQLENSPRWFLRQRERTSADGEFVLIPRTADRELALGHHRFGREHVAGYRVCSGVEIHRVEHGNLVRIGRLVV